MLDSDDRDGQSEAPRRWHLVPIVFAAILITLALYFTSYWLVPNPVLHAEYIPDSMYGAVSEGYSRFYYPVRRFRTMRAKSVTATVRVHRVASEYLETRFMNGEKGRYFCFDPIFREMVYSLREGDLIQVTAESRPHPRSPIDEDWITSIKKR